MNTRRVIALILLICLAEIGLKAQTVKRGPYLQMSTTNTTIIRWRTDVFTQSKVWYGTNSTNLSMTAISSGSTKEHEVQVDGLMPATVYYYAIGDDNGPYAPLHGTQYFKTHPADNFTPQPIRAWVLGNAGTKTNEQREVRDAYYAVVQNQHIDMMLLLGDNAYDDGKDNEYQDAWFENMYEARLVNTVMWSCFGNHDGGSADSEDESGPYYDIFNFPRNGEAGGVPSGTEAYYSFDYGNMHVISLNTADMDMDPGSPMLNWLEDDLAASEKKWLVTLLHHRPYTGSNNNDSDDDQKPTDVRKNILPILEGAGVDLVLTAHSHNYQRSFLINGHYGKSNTFDENEMGVDLGDGKADGDGAYSKANSNIGTVYVVTGSAGQDDSGADGLNHPVMQYNSGSAGSVQLLVSDNELVFQFINEDEEIEDYFTIEKGPSVPVSGFKISYPLEDAFFPPLHNITITTDTTESLMDIGHVNFYINEVLIGSDNSFPFNQSWTIPAAGTFQIKAIAHEAFGGETTESVVTISAGAQVICASITSGDNDAEEQASGSVNLGSSDLELTEEGSTQQIGLRFNNLNLPAGALIDSAFLQFTVDETRNINPCILQIYGEKNSNPSIFDNVSNNISNRSKTNAHITWEPDNWDVANESAGAQRTPNLASVLQELISQSGYNNQQPMVFIINGIGRRVAESYEGGANKAAELCIYYTPSFCPDADNDGVCDVIPCPSGLEVGAPCDDNSITTHDDVITADCICAGTPYECPILLLDIGAPCDDNNITTYNDVVTPDCNCIGIPYDCQLLLGDIGDPCDDGNPETNGDVIDVNCNCIGSLFDCPILEADIGAACDDGNPFTVNDEIDENCSCVGVLLNEETVNVPVSNGSDDAEERENGTVNLGSSDLELMFDRNNQIIGIRFVNTGIPGGAFITNAYIQFTVDEDDAIDPCQLTIFGQAADQPQTFTNQINNISLRPKTIAFASWQPALWSNVGESGIAQRTSDLTSILQELVNRPGYTLNSPMAFIIQGTGKRVADSYDGGASKAARLVVSYIYVCEDDDSDGVCNQQDVCANGPEPGMLCDDNNLNTYDDVIDGNCNCMGKAFDCPVLLANVGDPCDDGNPETVNDFINSDCICSGVAPGTETTICTRIASPTDDAEEKQHGSVNIGSSDIELIDDGSSQKVGLRFVNLNIPQGAVIQEATIQFEVDETNNTNPCELLIYGEASDSPSTFTESDLNISNRQRTSAEVTWMPPSWPVKGAAGTDQQSSDISSVIQEIVNRSGFSESSPLVIMIEGTGKRVAESYEGTSEGAAELCIVYSLATPPTAMMSSPNGDAWSQAAGDDALDIGHTRTEATLSADVSNLKVYPNPAKDQINLSFYSFAETETEIEIRDVNGQLIFTRTYQIAKGNTQLKIANLNLPNGMYVVRVTKELGWQSCKFIVLK